MPSKERCKSRNAIAYRPVPITRRSHLFPFRTQKLSSVVPKILGWRRPGKIGRCRLSLCLFVMPGTAWRASAIRLPGGPAPTGNGRQRRPGKRPGRRMLCGKTPGERTRRSSLRLQAGERFFRQRLHGTPAGGEAVRLMPQPGRAASSRLRAGGTLLLAASKCTSAARAGCPLNVAARVGHLLAAASGGTALLTTSARYAGGAGQLRLTDRAA